MALVKCRECGKEISHTADTCPNCGAESPQLSEYAFQTCKKRQSEREFWNSGIGSFLKLGIGCCVIFILFIFMIITGIGI